MENKNKKKQCCNCIFASKGFKIAGITHHQCNHPKHAEGLKTQKISAWDTLQEFYSTCESHEYKRKIKMLLPNTNLNFVGFGTDNYGRKTLKLKFEDSQRKAISIPIMHTPKSKILLLKQCLSENDLQVIATEIVAYIKEYGTTNEKQNILQHEKQ